MKTLFSALVLSVAFSTPASAFGFGSALGIVEAVVSSPTVKPIQHQSYDSPDWLSDDDTAINQQNDATRQSGITSQGQSQGSGNVTIIIKGDGNVIQGIDQNTTNHNGSSNDNGVSNSH